LKEETANGFFHYRKIVINYSN